MKLLGGNYFTSATYIPCCGYQLEYSMLKESKQTFCSLIADPPAKHLKLINYRYTTSGQSETSLKTNQLGYEDLKGFITCYN